MLTNTRCYINAEEHVPGHGPQAKPTPKHYSSRSQRKEREASPLEAKVVRTTPLMPAAHPNDQQGAAGFADLLGYMSSLPLTGRQEGNLRGAKDQAQGQRAKQKEQKVGEGHLAQGSRAQCPTQQPGQAAFRFLFP